MRNLILIIVISLSMTSCIRWDIGMNEGEFYKRNRFKGIMIDSRTENTSIYRAGNGYNSYFYYFVNGQLVEMNRGEFVPNIIIENRQ